MQKFVFSHEWSKLDKFEFIFGITIVENALEITNGVHQQLLELDTLVNLVVLSIDFSCVFSTSAKRTQITRKGEHPKFQMNQPFYSCYLTLVAFLGTVIFSKIYISCAH